MLTRTVRARRRWTGTSVPIDAGAVDVDEQGIVVARREPQLVARASAEPVERGRRRRLAERPVASSLGRTPCGEQRTDDPILGREHRLAQEFAAQLVELALGEAVERGDEPGSGRHAGVDLVGGEVVVEREVDGVDAVDADTASWASATIR